MVFIKKLVQNLWQIEDGLVRCFSFKIEHGLLPSYLQSYLNHCNDGEYQTRSACQNKMKTLSGRAKAFNSSFYPATNSYFTHYSSVVIILFKWVYVGLRFLPIPIFLKTNFSSFCAFCVFCFEWNVLNQHLNICVIII